MKRVPYRIRIVRDLEEYRQALAPIEHYFGDEPTDEDVERLARLMPQERVHAAFDGDRVVGGAGVFPLELTVPGGVLPCAGVSIVGVLPSDRRRGVLKQMMEAQLAHARQAGEPIAALWASEETIYGRFGYGLAGLCLILDADRTKVRIGGDAPPNGKVRLVDHDEALRVFPRIYERVRRRTVGMPGRTRDWWELRRLSDRPEQRRSAGPLVRALLERDGRPVGYATYRIASSGSTPIDWKKTVRVLEAHGVDDAATRDIWRFLFEIDWTDRVAVFDLPLDHPLLLLADRVNELHAMVLDGLWLRLLDVDAALAARTYRPGRATIEIATDPQFPDNVGLWRIADGTARRARAGARADIRLPVDALGAAYLGGVTIRQLVGVGKAEELVRGGAARADAVLAVDRQPWCAEVF